MARVALRTPARITLPAVKPAETFFETNNNSSSATEAPWTRFIPKSPEREMKPPIIAWKPWIVTED